MPGDIELTELVPEPGAGRCFELPWRAGIADATASGRARVDAIARWLQDVAYLDSVDGGLVGAGVWIVRRTRIRVEAFPRFGEELVARTFCSGIGRFSAERRTNVTGESARVEAVALWVYLDPESLRPIRFEPDFGTLYEESAAGRGAQVRLHHPDPPTEAESGRWTFRVTDLDPAGHVNNSHYWGPLEQELAAEAEPESVDAEIEYRTAAEPGEATVLRDGPWTWITGEAGVLASILRAV